MGLKFVTSVANGLKLRVRKFCRLIPTFVEVTGEILVGEMGGGEGGRVGGWSAKSILNMVKETFFNLDINYMTSFC